MGMYAIKMPDIGEGIAEVELVEWRVQTGETVAEDQVVADVMTDKATVEIPSPVAGTVMSLGAQPGQMIAVGAELIRLEVDGEGNVREAGVPAAQAAAATLAASAAAATPARESVQPAPAPAAAPAAPAAQRRPERTGAPPHEGALGKPS